MSDTQIVYIRETLWRSVASDCVTLLTLVSMIGLGVLLKSEAMQWVGAIVFFLSLMARFRSGYPRMTPQEAADRLAKDFGVVGKVDGK